MARSETRKRILVVSQYFWPENFRINELALELKNRGYLVEVLTSTPNYPEGRVFSDFTSNLLRGVKSDNIIILCK